MPRLLALPYNSSSIRIPAASADNSPDYIYLVSMAIKAAFANRNRRLGDPQFVDVRLDELISEERAAEWRDVIDSGAPIDVARIQPGSTSTTQVTVVDRHGNCVSLTHSLGTSSQAISPGLGFMYNNSMVNFYPYAGRPNSIAPGKGRTTGMTPNLVLRDGRPKLAVGAPGATRIITAVLQTIRNRLDFGMSIAEAVLAPRFDCQMEVAVELSEAVTELGLSKTVSKNVGLDGSQKDITVYFLSKRPVAVKLIAKALNAEDLEIGRSIVEAEFGEDDAQYVTFHFDPEMDRQMVRRYAIDIRPTPAE